MENVCPNSEKCPIFSGILVDKAVTAKSYRKQFCEAGESKWITCKRFMTKQKYGTCPSDLLPNSIMTLEQIAQKYHLN